ncbi:MAG TPA: hypothetical protein VN698_13015 [Bacteroidia bacterium]|nr:hypothetical protein [Bacteroidia bacterium]
MSDDLGRDFEYLYEQTRVVFNRLPVILGNVAENFFKDSFRRQAWIDTTTENWAKVKKPKRKGAAILVKTGGLKRDIRTIQANWDGVIIKNEKPYAGIHNDGFSGTEKVKGFKRKQVIKKARKGKSAQGYKLLAMKRVRIEYVKPFTRKMRMPRRRFMGPSVYLNMQLDRAAINQLKTI